MKFDVIPFIILMLSRLYLSASEKGYVSKFGGRILGRNNYLLGAVDIAKK